MPIVIGKYDEEEKAYLFKLTNYKSIDNKSLRKELETLMENPDITFLIAREVSSIKGRKMGDDWVPGDGSNFKFEKKPRLKMKIEEDKSRSLIVVGMKQNG